MRTVLEVVRLSTTYLADRGSPSPRLDAELLIAKVLTVGRIDLYLQHDRPLPEGQLAAIRELLRRRAAGEPVAHLMGTREFYGRPFLVSPAVLIPRPDTETLIEQVLTWARKRAGEAGEGLRIADIGTGSGCIACTLAAELPGASVAASDLSPEALVIAGRNAAQLGVTERVTFVAGSWGEPFGEATFDAVVSNPPYVTSGELGSLDPGVRDHEPRVALDGGAEGLDAYRELLPAASRLLRSDGYLALEVDPRRADQVAALMLAAMPDTEPVLVNDLTGRPRVVAAERCE